MTQSSAYIIYYYMQCKLFFYATSYPENVNAFSSLTYCRAVIKAYCTLVSSTACNSVLNKLITKIVLPMKLIFHIIIMSTIAQYGTMECSVDPVSVILILPLQCIYYGQINRLLLHINQSI